MKDLKEIKRKDIEDSWVTEAKQFSITTKQAKFSCQKNGAWRSVSIDAGRKLVLSHIRQGKRVEVLLTFQFQFESKSEKDTLVDIPLSRLRELTHGNTEFLNELLGIHWNDTEVAMDDTKEIEMKKLKLNASWGAFA
jgi:hypothetical protein